MTSCLFSRMGFLIKIALSHHCEIKVSGQLIKSSYRKPNFHSFYAASILGNYPLGATQYIHYCAGPSSPSIEMESQPYVPQIPPASNQSVRMESEILLSRVGCNISWARKWSHIIWGTSKRFISGYMRLPAYIFMIEIFHYLVFLSIYFG